MAIATLHLAAIPLIAGLAAGTGAVATYVAVPSDASAQVTEASTQVAAAPQPCDAQTWPYVDRACMPSASAADEAHKMRVVIAPRPEEKFDTRWATATRLLPPAFPGMTTSDGVLRGPQNVDAIPNAPATAAAPAPTKRTEAKREKRKRSEPRVVSQPYVVPAERDGTTREVLVVRPQPVDFFR